MGPNTDDGHDYVDLSVQGRTTCALTADGIEQCWSSDTYPPARYDGAALIAARR